MAISPSWNCSSVHRVPTLKLPSWRRFHAFAFEVGANEREHDPIELFPVDLAPSAQESLPLETRALCNLLGGYVASHGVEADTGEPPIRRECPPRQFSDGLGGEAMPALLGRDPVTDIPVARTPPRTDSPPPASIGASLDRARPQRARARPASPMAERGSRRAKWVDRGDTVVRSQADFFLHSSTEMSL